MDAEKNFFGDDAKRATPGPEDIPFADAPSPEGAPLWEESFPLDTPPDGPTDAFATEEAAPAEDFFLAAEGAAAANTPAEEPLRENFFSTPGTAEEAAPAPDATPKSNAGAPAPGGPEYRADGTPLPQAVEFFTGDGKQPDAEAASFVLYPDIAFGEWDSTGETALATRNRRKHRRATILFAVLCPLLVAVLLFSVWQIVRIGQGYQAAQDEYDGLAQLVNPPSSQADASAQGGAAAAQEEDAAPYTLAEVKALNPDCVGWIEIPGTTLNYPLVRGTNNEHYLNQTFLGNPSTAGAIFMDYRNNTDFTSPHTLVYGHNLKNGAMFGGLHQYTGEAYLLNHSYIYIHTDTAILRYRVYTARIVDMWDAAYQMDFADEAALEAFSAGYGGPADATRLLTLSTCTNNADDERILVMAAYDGEGVL